jgi:hypothetical protein
MILFALFESLTLLLHFIFIHNRHAIAFGVNEVTHKEIFVIETLSQENLGWGWLPLWIGEFVKPELELH